MTYVVTESCIRCKYTDCVDVCPVDCFREGPNILVIDPDECIDCTLCVAECPVDAIFAHDDVREDQQHFIDLNADLSKVRALNADLSKVWKPIIERKAAPPDADKLKHVKGKLADLVLMDKDEHQCVEFKLHSEQFAAAGFSTAYIRMWEYEELKQKLAHGPIKLVLRYGPRKLDLRVKHDFPNQASFEQVFEAVGELKAVKEAEVDSAQFLAQSALVFYRK